MANLKVLFRDPATGRLRLGLPKPSQKVSGIDSLVQNVALLFMTNGGRSIASPGRAGGLRDFLGTSVDFEDPSELFADVRLMVIQVERQIKEEQVKTRRPPSELLLALYLVDIVPDSDQPEIDIIVSVVNQEQQQAQAVVVT